MKKKLPGIIIFLAVFFMPFRAVCNGDLLIGLIPEENIFRQMDRHRPLADYLTSRLGIKVKLTILSSYGDIMDRFVTRKMDGAFFGVLTGALATEKLGVEPIAQPVKLDGTTSTRSYLFVRRNSGIKTVLDMKGKRMVFADKTSVSYLFALAFLREKGVMDIDTYFKEHYFTGGHDAVIYSVLDNRADIGSAESKVYKMMVIKDPTINEELQIIEESGEFPDTTLCLSKDLPAELKNKIRTILITMDKEAEGRAVLEKMEVSKFVGVNRIDFLPLWDLARDAGIDLKDYKYK